MVPERIDVVENGVDLERFTPLPPSERDRVRMAWGMSGRRALVVPGRLCEQKNQRAVLRALASMQRRGALPGDVKVIFAGRGSPPVYAEALRAYASFVGLGRQVELVGVVRAIEQLVAGADAVLLPSRFEGLPNAVVEAMACATPVIVSPAANTDALVTDGHEGLVSASASAEAIERVLERFLALDSGALREMGAAGRAHAERRFAVDRMVNATMRVYERVLARRAPRLHPREAPYDPCVA
jgi:glycosyltransferase involved in cell wall biosynthesis